MPRRWDHNRGEGRLPDRPGPRCRCGERGFTLLEALIATAIAAMVLGVLLRTAVGGIGAVREAANYQLAVALARSHLTMLGRNMAGVPTDSQGNDGPFGWRIRVAPEAAASSGTGIVDWYLHKDELQATLYSVSVTVSWQSDGRRRELDVHTQRLGLALPTSPQP